MSVSVSQISNDGSALGPVLMLGLLVLVILIWLHDRKKKRDESHFRERKDSSSEKSIYEGYSSASFGAKDISTDCRTEKEKTSDGTAAGSVKYGRGFGKNAEQQKKKPPKETEDFYRYDRKENDRIVCLDCGVENSPDSAYCLLCGRSLR